MLAVLLFSLTLSLFMTLFTDGTALLGRLLAGLDWHWALLLGAVGPVGTRAAAGARIWNHQEDETPRAPDAQRGCRPTPSAIPARR
jgi:hypothetical protein